MINACLIVRNIIVSIRPVTLWVTPAGHFLQLGLQLLGVTLKVSSQFCYLAFKRRAFSIVFLLTGCDLVIKLLRPSVQQQHKSLGLRAQRPVRPQQKED